jgi:hypothetical protein
MLVAIPHMAGFSRTKRNGSGKQTHGYSGIPPANPAANLTANANRYMEDKAELIEEFGEERQNRMKAMGNNWIGGLL